MGPASLLFRLSVGRWSVPPDRRLFPNRLQFLLGGESVVWAALSRNVLLAHHRHEELRVLGVLSAVAHPLALAVLLGRLLGKNVAYLVYLVALA